MTMKVILRRALFVLGLAFAGMAVAAPAEAATPAETFVQDNIHVGLDILNNKSLSTDARRTQFANFLLSLTDMKRIADFTLGQYRRGASPADLAAFDAAFQNYAVAVYQSYFAKYAGQTLKVTNSQARTPDDFIVATALIDPNDHSGQAPLEVDFRVRTDAARPEVTDLNVMGVWLALSQRDQFVSYLAAHGGSVPALTAHVLEVTAQLGRPAAQ